MPLLFWSEKFSVGISVFDEDHKKLMALINELFDALRVGQGMATLGTIFNQLIEYTGYHFAREEEWMTRYEYSGLAMHRLAHQELVRQVLELQDRYRKGDSAALTLDVMNFLRDWLTKHIRGSDASYGPYFVSKGLK